MTLGSPRFHLAQIFSSARTSSTSASKHEQCDYILPTPTCPKNHTRMCISYCRLQHETTFWFQKLLQGKTKSSVYPTLAALCPCSQLIAVLPGSSLYTTQQVSHRWWQAAEQNLGLQPAVGTSAVETSGPCIHDGST